MLPQLDHRNEIVNHFLELLNLLYLVLNAQRGAVPARPEDVDCHELASKLFLHASSIYDLRQGTLLPLPAQDEPALFYDIASVIVLARAALEAYLTLFEVFFQEITADEFDFRYSLWQLAGTILPESHNPADPIYEADRARAAQRGQALRQRLEATPTFQGLSRRQKEAVLRGDRLPQPLEQRAEAAGFGPRTLQFVWDYYSGYVHSDYLGVSQVNRATTSDSQIAHMEIHVQLVMMVLGKVIVNYASRFPTASECCDANPVAYARAQGYAQMAQFID